MTKTNSGFLFMGLAVLLWIFGHGIGDASAASSNILSENLSLLWMIICFALGAFGVYRVVTGAKEANAVGTGRPPEPGAWQSLKGSFSKEKMKGPITRTKSGLILVAVGISLNLLGRIIKPMVPAQTVVAEIGLVVAVLFALLMFASVVLVLFGLFRLVAGLISDRQSSATQ